MARSEAQKEAERRYAKKREKRFKLWATVIYPESAPSDWLARLDELHTPLLISPLHSKDVDPDGQPKKEHYHVLAMFENPISADDFRNYVAAAGAVGQEHVISQRGYARYLCHLDNPEKAQYQPSEVIALGGASWHDSILSGVDKVKMQQRIEEAIIDCGFYYYSDLKDWAKENEPEIYHALTMYARSETIMYIQERRRKWHEFQ